MNRKEKDNNQEKKKKRYIQPIIKEYSTKRFVANLGSVGGGGSTAAGGTIPVI